MYHTESLNFGNLSVAPATAMAHNFPGFIWFLITHDGKASAKVSDCSNSNGWNGSKYKNWFLEFRNQTKSGILNACTDMVKIYC